MFRLQILMMFSDLKNTIRIKQMFTRKKFKFSCKKMLMRFQNFSKMIAEILRQMFIQQQVQVYGLEVQEVKESYKVTRLRNKYHNKIL